VVSGLNPQRLVVDGRVVTTAIALTHPTHLQRLRQECPPAAAAGVVVGDPALARMLGSRFRADHLRAAFGARAKRLVLVASTYGPDSVLGRLPELPELLATALPADEYRVVVVLHPGVWAAHGPWQVRAWLGRAAAYGIQVLSPHEGWQAALLAASVVISDHGSLAVYAAALGKPVILAGRGSTVTVPGSASAVLAAVAPIWDPAADPRRQLDEVIDQPAPMGRNAVADLLIEPTADTGPRLRALIYRLLRLAEPESPADFGPVLAPPAVAGPVLNSIAAADSVPALIAGAEPLADGVRVERFADLGAGQPHGDLTYRHLIADVRTASLTQLGSADIIVTGQVAAGSLRLWAGQAATELHRWPRAVMLAAPVGGTACAVWTERGLLVLTADEPLDPTVLASLAYARLETTGKVPPVDRLHLGARVIEVTATD
jgi:hypothetical protein